MNGHSDVIMGALVVKDTELLDRLAYIQNCMYLFIKVKKKTVSFVMISSFGNPLKQICFLLQNIDIA